MTQNILMNQKLSEYHTGYRAFTGNVLESVDYNSNSDDFVFDNQMLAQIFYAGFEIAEITCPTKYFEEASSINIARSMKYGVGVLKVSLMYFLQKTGLCPFQSFWIQKRKDRGIFMPGIACFVTIMTKAYNHENTYQ